MQFRNGQEWPKSTSEPTSGAPKFEYEANAEHCGASVSKQYTVALNSFK